MRQHRRLLRVERMRQHRIPHTDMMQQMQRKAGTESDVVEGAKAAYAGSVSTAVVAKAARVARAGATEVRAQHSSTQQYT